MSIVDGTCGGGGIIDTKRTLIFPQSTNPNPDDFDLLCPLTPDLKLNIDRSISSDEENPQTPKASVFDSFAPGPDKFMLAPLRTKCTDDSEINVVRRLDFQIPGDLFGGNVNQNDLITSGSDDEDDLFEVVYSSILEVIVSEQRSEMVSDDSDGFSTPKSAPRLSWFAETCPGAPVKAFSKYRGKIDNELCRKLEF